mgnify:FL=1
MSCAAYDGLFIEVCLSLVLCPQYVVCLTLLDDTCGLMVLVLSHIAAAIFAPA